MPTTKNNGCIESPTFTKKEEADAELEAALERRRSRKAAETNPTTEQPRKKRPVLDPPYNPMGMAILNAAKKGMEHQEETGSRNKRACRMQRSIVDYQRAMNLSLSDDPPKYSYPVNRDLGSIVATTLTQQASDDLVFDGCTVAMNEAFEKAERTDQEQSVKGGKFD